MAGERGVNINSTAPNQEYEYAEDRGAIYHGIFGQSGILNIAEKLECTKYSNNEVRIASGDFINQGYQIRIPFGETCALEIENGTVGQKRYDLIVAEFERVSQLKDTHAFKVIKGTSAAATPQDPALIQQDLNAGGTLRQEPLYRVVLDGIEITAIERIADYIDMQDAAKLGGIFAADTLQYRGTPSAEINDVKTNGAYILSGSATFLHVPENFGTLLVFGGDPLRVGQILIGVSGKLFSRIFTNNAWTAWKDAWAVADAAIPKKGGSVVSGHINPTSANKVRLGATSLPWEYVVAKDLYAHGGQLISRNTSNMTGDFMAMTYANHSIQNAQTGDAMKLCSSAGLWVRDTGNSAWVSINAAAFNQQSSARSKNILGELTLERARKILSLDLIKFIYKAEFDNSGKTYYGVVAEQLEELELFDMLTYDMDGLPSGVDYAKFAPYLIRIVKDHDERIKQLESKAAARDKTIADLTVRLVALEKK